MMTDAGRLTRWLLIAVPVPGISWAAALSADRAAQRVPLMGQVWVLRDLQNDRVARSRPEAATIAFFKGHVIAGTVSCNSVGGRELTWTAKTSSSGTFSHDASQATIMTVVGCPKVEALRLGGRFWEMMKTASAWSIAGATLTISFSDRTTASLMPAPIGTPHDSRRNGR
ncbi:heat shock protein HslJ [Sphingomonas sp. BE270]|jgi:hypothetical protein|nr:META domain-containing protein [Sphingomonas sp. BE270]MDR7260395.1 heat shock protein HslJ [Sphingomonas sp. BE270]